MSRMMLAALVAAFHLITVPVTGAETEGKETTAAKTRIAELREISRRYGTSAKKPVPPEFSAEQRREAQKYVEWLRESAAECAALADRWERELGAASSAHETPKTDFGSALKQGAQKTPNENASAPFVPGGAVVSAAATGSNPEPANRQAKREGDRGTPSRAAGGLPTVHRNFNSEYVALQRRLRREGRQFTAISNSMKIKHDTAKAAINNVR